MDVWFSNPAQPENEAVKVSFPIPEDDYERIIGQLGEIGIGDAAAQDCKVDKIDNPVYWCLTSLVGQQVNVDELDYLTKRLENLESEYNYPAMAEKLGLKDIRDFINLTLIADDTTIIRRFDDMGVWEKEGKTHFMTVNGGCTREQLRKLDGIDIITNLIATGTGTVTQCGVIFDNGHELPDIYRGGPFPEHHERPDVLYGRIAQEPYPDLMENPTVLYFPMSDLRLERAMKRGGLKHGRGLTLVLDNDDCPPQVLDAMGDRWTIDADSPALRDINAMCAAIQPLTDAQKRKLDVVIDMAKPVDMNQIRRLAENLDQFVVHPHVSAEERIDCICEKSLAELMGPPGPQEPSREAGEQARDCGKEKPQTAKTPAR